MPQILTPFSDALRTEDERERPALNVRQHPIGHGLVIFSELPLGDGPLRKHQLVGMGDGDAGNFRHDAKGRKNHSSDRLQASDSRL